MWGDSLYNEKIKFSDTFTEIWTYSKPIGQGRKEQDRDDVKKRRSFEELSKEEQKEKLIRLQRHRQECKWELMRLIETNWDSRTSFITLTTKEKFERDKFTEQFMKFIKRLNYQVFGTKKATLKYVATLETQKRGAYHAHCLFFSVPFIEHKKLLKIWGLGGVRINKLNKLDDVSNCGRYCVKYMEKSLGQELLYSVGKKAYLRSRNLKIPEEVKIFSVKPLEFDKELIVYESDYFSKVYVEGKLVNNPVHYRKIRNKGKCSDDN
ncbi:rep protein [Liquorilactobacillus hordei DSM 19519]|uniref:Rep protein n=1 Tax=Liquorilactobacillus hordei DSM 19519 TaxID=1423759 RepID=A0A0R1MK51_9LACO|nr:rep protein [Liquorilactobacillus hordei DSM 19519]